MAGGSDIFTSSTGGSVAARWRALARAARRWLPVLVVLALVVATGATAAAARKGEVAGSVSDGFARLVITFPEEAEAEVRQANGIVIIAFKQPLELDIDRLAASMPGYVSVARLDPDGNGLRLGVARRVKVNSMAAGERLFVDLLPDGWSGLPPSLPKEVIEDLARRAREAERKVRQQQQQPAAAPVEQVRVRVATLPTLTRYTFGLRELVAVATDRGKDTFSVTFDKPLKFDLAEVKSMLPPTVASVEAESDDDKAVVRFALVGKVDVRSFRDDGAFVLDVSVAGSRDADVRPGANPNEAGPPAWLPPTRPGATPRAAERPAPAPHDAAAAAAAPVRPAAANSGQAASSKPASPAPAPASQAMTPPAAPIMEEQPVRAPAPTEAKAGEAMPAATAHAAVPPAASPAMPAQPPSAGPPATTNAPPAMTAPPPAMAAAPSPMAAPPANGPVIALAKPQGDMMRLIFPFPAGTPAAIFRRDDTLWLVFDTAAAVDVSRLRQDGGRFVRAASSERAGSAQVVRLRLDRRDLASASADGSAWIVSLGATVIEPAAPLTVERMRVSGTQATATIPFDQPHRVHPLRDPDGGARLFAVTGLAPTRGMAKSQNFVEFQVLQSTQGVAVEAIADDVSVDAVPERIVIARPGGLILTPTSGTRPAGEMLVAARPVAIDVQSWGFDRQADFRERASTLMNALSDAPEPRRNGVRMDIARFYLAREMQPEAKGALDVVVANERDNAALSQALVLRAIANIRLGREDLALKDLNNPIVGSQHDAQLWRALALSRQGRFGEAREGLQNIDAASAGLPIELQRFALKEAVRCAVEVGDFARAARELNDFDGLGVSEDMKGSLALLSGRVAEGLGKLNDALGAYASAAESHDLAAAAAGRLKQTELRLTLKQIKSADATAELEQLTTGWRGDVTELEALQLMARLYTEESRYRDAFQVMRVALTANPRSPLTQRIQDSAAKTFDSIFLGDRGDKLPPVEALGLFYDFRRLTPPGRRGDEMIRRLAERLIGMDLLKQASELLQHQIDHRLIGAGRAQVATRLATVYLMNRRPEQALQALQSTRMADLSNDLRQQRLLLEARALSDTGRHDLALEIVQDMSGREVERLRADIFWNARRWREAAEQVERLYGDRWREPTPLDAFERTDALRAAIGYALSADTIGLDRFRQKYAAKMTEGPDRRLFEVLTGPPSARGDEFAEIAKSASSVDTLGAFLRDLRVRFPNPPAGPSAGAQPSQG